MTAAPLHAHMMLPPGLPLHFGPSWPPVVDSLEHQGLIPQSEQPGIPNQPPHAPPNFVAQLHQARNQPVLHIGENKPRLTKEQADRLEGVFTLEYKPSTQKKKELANEMGVELAKVNNWFQNRRAKSKHDRKKEQMAQSNTFQLSPPQPVFVQAATVAESGPSVQQQPPMQAAGADGHHQTYPAEPAAEQISAHPQLQQDFTQTLQPIGEASQPTSMADMYTGLTGFSLDQSNPMALGDLPSQPQMLEYQQQQHPQPHSDMAASHTDNFANFGFGNMSAVYTPGPTEVDPAMYAGFPFGHDMTIPLHTVGHAGSISPEMSGQAHHVTNSTASSKHPSLEPSTPVPVFGESQKMVKTDSVHTIFNSSPELVANIQATPELAGLSNDWAGFQQQMIDPHFPLQGFNPQNRSPDQVFVNPVPEQQMTPQQHCELPEDVPTSFPSEAFSRRPSSTAGLVENMNSVGLQAHASQASADSTFKAPSVSGLASRRQRRPAQLQGSAFRSASYSAGMPTSPGPNPNLADSHTLRRIRSTGIAAASIGRVQKNAGPQRSPLAFTFDESGQPSPRVLRHSSLATPFPQKNSSLAPPTPATPEVGSRFPSLQQPSAIKSEHAHNAVEGLGVQWAGSQGMPGNTGSSPPDTPMENALVEQLRNYQLQVQWRDTPPQSAPAFQTAFQQSSDMPPPPLPAQASSFVHNHAGLLNMTMHGGRRPSAPDASFMMAPEPTMHYNFVPAFDAAGNIVSMPVEQLPAHMPFQMPQNGLYMQGQQVLTLTPPMMSSTVTTPPRAQIDGNFVVHEYTPPPGSEKLSSPPQLKQAQIKNYTFENKNPSHFSSPS